MLQPWQAQLINRVNARLTKDAQVIMAKQEIVARTLHPLKNIWWKWVPGTKITVAWPGGQPRLVPVPGGWSTSIDSSDPNDHFREWLETNVGRQGWDWDWRLGPGIDDLEIKFRLGRRQFATAFELVFAR